MSMRINHFYLYISFNFITNAPEKTFYFKAPRDWIICDLRIVRRNTWRKLIIWETDLVNSPILVLISHGLFKDANYYFYFTRLPSYGLHK